jgi:hypothetical protein
MKVRISDIELARAIAIGLAVTGKRGQSRDHEVSILRQLGRYDVFRNADAAETASADVPLFADNYGIVRAVDAFNDDEADRRQRHSQLDWPLKLDRRRSDGNAA